MPRPFFRSSISELEEAFSMRNGEPAFLRSLIIELGLRTTDKAKKLRRAAEEALANCGKSRGETSGIRKETAPPQAPPSNAEQGGSEPASFNTEEDSGFAAEPHSQVVPPINNRPEEILSAWTAFEVLSPPSFRRPEDLAGGDRRNVAFFEDGLPWERGEKSRPKYRLYYQIVLGSIQMQRAIEQLIKRYGDSRPEFPSTKGDAILAVVIIDKQGCLVESPAITVSSFGWGVMTALKGKLTDLARWPQAEAEIVRKLENRLLSFAPGDEDEERRKVPLTHKTLLSTYHALVQEIGLPPDMVEPPRFAIRSYEYFKSSNPPEPLLLNSFFLADLAKGRALVKEGTAPANLKRYLGIGSPQNRADLLRNREALERALAPAMTSLAKWPGPGRKPLALLQQAAVNLAFSETRNGGMLGVNGPPGTGKTTLLRDVLAGVVVERAQQLCRFDEPEPAFKHSGEKLKAGNGWLHLYQLDPKLRGFEMIVASSNNKAVENVSRELPAMSSIAADADNLRYFSLLADELHERETWGMVAAVLGNAANRSRFKQTFWWDEDLSMNSYLSAAAGNLPQITEPDPETGRSKFRSPKIVTAEHPPEDSLRAVARWKQARKEFQAALDQSLKWQKWLEIIRHELAAIGALITAEKSAKEARDISLSHFEGASERLSSAEQLLDPAKARLQSSEEECIRHFQGRPGFWARLFRTSSAVKWTRERALLSASVEDARNELDVIKREISDATEASRVASEANRQAETRFQAALAARTESEGRLTEAQERYGVILPDDDFFFQGHNRRHQATLWFPPEAQRVREDLFVAAMHLHRAFIDAAAKPIRHNLGALMNVLSGGSLSNADKEALLPELWATFFLVVPMVSTTFAAVGRMLGKLPPESLGWLLVDEAGQALPQAAVGAVIRSKRVIVVGDPAQIEPVVLLPDTLTHAISRSFGVDPDRFAAPVASVQTLTDHASNFASEFHTRLGSRTVGVPLLVHRRCADPMFSISNAIAYSGLMVQAKPSKHSPIRDCLGPSRWIHIQGKGEDKWCESEGAEVIRLLRIITEKGIPADIYIVTPFVIVADRLRQLIREAGVFRGLLDEGEVRKWIGDHVGTVHTVQGREAEAVIFVLGAPNPSQVGARGWAGGRPNLLNVAVTRAKEVLYVIGNRELWRDAGHFRELDAHLG